MYNFQIVIVQMVDALAEAGLLPMAPLIKAAAVEVCKDTGQIELPSPGLQRMSCKNVLV